MVAKPSMTVKVVIPVCRMARIHDAILGAGFSASGSVMGGNWLRVLEQVV